MKGEVTISGHSLASELCSAWVAGVGGFINGHNSGISFGPHVQRWGNVQTPLKGVWTFPFWTLGGWPERGVGILAVG